MIKQAFSLLALLLPLSMQAQHKLSAQIAGLGTDVTVFLSNVDNPDKVESLDSAKVAADGSFSLRVPLKKPRMCNITFWQNDKAKGRSYKLSTVSLLLDGTADVTMKGDTTQLFGPEREKTLTISGGGETLAGWLVYEHYISDQQKRADDASYAEASTYFEHLGDRSKYRDLMIAKDREVARLDSMQTVWMEGHASSAAAAYILGKRYYQSFTYPKDIMAKWIDEVTADNADTARASFLKRNRDIVMTLSLGIPFPDFSATTKAGSPVKFSTLVPKGKYTLVDFWASWCGPCRAAIPKVKKIYATQKGRLNVVSVSVDQREADWRRAEKQEAMPWTQLWLNKAQLNRAALAYDIQSIPRLVLINPEGKIQLVSFDPDKMEAALHSIPQPINFE